MQIYVFIHLGYTFSKNFLSELAFSVFSEIYIDLLVYITSFYSAFLISSCFNTFFNSGSWTCKILSYWTGRHQSLYLFNLLYLDIHFLLVNLLLSSRNLQQKVELTKKEQHGINKCILTCAMYYELHYSPTCFSPQNKSNQFPPTESNSTSLSKND